MGYEYIVVTLAAALAGIGTGLVGLSAATAIALGCWDFLLIAVVAATLFSLISAQFANKINGKIAGYVTGAILLVLGFSMTVINSLGKII